MRTVTVEQRRSALVARHHLSGDAANARTVVGSLVALHATDPATVYLSVLARSRTTSITDLAEQMYQQRTLVRWMAMRRTLFLFDRDEIPVIHAAAGAPLGTTLRRRLLTLIGRNGIDPPVEGDPSDWLAAIEDRMEDAVVRRGSATGPEVRADVPAVRARIPARTRSETSQSLTSPLLTVMSAQGRLVRGAPTGAWTSRGHRWEPVADWWPAGLPHLDPAAARATLARRWLDRYGPATVEDLRWWTGWNRTITHQALSSLDIEEVDLHGRSGIDLVDHEAIEAVEPVAALLPALDPTPMGWRHREWFTAVDPAALFDTAGNIGPTVWWDGELIGGWASTTTGIRTRILADRGRHAADAVRTAAAQLQRRLDGTTITPAARTPLERELSIGLERPSSRDA